MDLSLPTTSLATVLATCGVLTYRCAKSPNPNPTQSKSNDRIAAVAGLDKPYQLLPLFLLFTNHLLLVLFPASRASFCRNPDLLNSALFTWSTRSLVFVGMIMLAAPLRLLAYHQLGKNFTFRLNKPSELFTGGLYSYVQHPSYTTLFVIAAASVSFWGRIDGVAACYLPAAVVTASVRGVGLSEWIAVCAMAVVGATMVVRIRDEESMLKNAFGKEWVNYHRRTRRLVPGVF